MAKRPLASSFIFMVLTSSADLSLRKPSRVKAKVTRLATRSLQHLRNANVGHHLENAREESNVSEGSERDERIVCGGGGEALPFLGKGINPGSQVNSSKSSSCEHGNTAVLQLSLTEVVHGEVVGESKRIKPGLFADISLAVLWVREERNSRALLSIESSGSLAS